MFAILKKISCKERDADLLFYKLGELPFAREIAVAWHIRRCPRCRKRLSELTAVSGQFARILRSPGGTSREPHRIPAHIHLWVGAAIVVIVFLLSVLTVRLVAQSYAAPQMAPRDDGCRPGLPNDRCR